MTSFTIPTAATVLRINGKPYGCVSSFSWSSSTPQKAVNGIDDLAAQELIPTSASVSGNISLYRITGSGGLEGAGLTTSFDEIPRERYFVLQLVDTRTDQILFEARSCKVESQQWNVAAKSLITGSCSFRGLQWNNESAT